jgi:hypothetical protein
MRLRSEEVRAQIQPIVERVRTDLAGERPEISLRPIGAYAPAGGPRSEVGIAIDYGRDLPSVDYGTAGETARKDERKVMAWEPIPLSIYGNALPAMIRSSWVFILRAGTNTGAERHPNSHQRMMSFEGSGDMQVEDEQQTSDVSLRPIEVYAPAGGQMSEVSEFRNAKGGFQNRNPQDSSQRSEKPETSNAERSTPNAEVRPQSAEPSGKWQSNVLVSDPVALLERRWISIPENVWHQPVVSKEADWVVVSFHTVPAEELIEERPIDRAASRTKQMVYLDKR